MTPTIPRPDVAPSWSTNVPTPAFVPDEVLITEFNADFYTSQHPQPSGVFALSAGGVGQQALTPESGGGSSSRRVGAWRPKPKAPLEKALEFERTPVEPEYKTPQKWSGSRSGTSG